MTLKTLGFALQIGDRVLVKVPSQQTGIRYENGILQQFSVNQRAIRVTHMHIGNGWLPLEDVIDVLPERDQDPFQL
jgi:hypothetical protein